MVVVREQEFESISFSAVSDFVKQHTPCFVMGHNAPFDTTALDRKGLVDEGDICVSVLDIKEEPSPMDEPSVGSVALPPSRSCSDVVEDRVEAGAVEDFNEMIFLNDFEEDLSVDVAEMAFDFVPNDNQNVLAEKSVSERNILDENAPVNIRGMRALPEAELFAAGKGTEKQRSEHNDKWSLRRVDELRSQLGWDMNVPFVNLPFKEMDDLLQNLFSRVTKVNGEQYPGASLVNMMNGFNRMIRRAYDLRVLNGIPGEVAEKDFNIKRHRSFTRTRLVLNAAIKKGGREGVNKKVKKAPEITQPMEDAIFIDHEHQVTNNYGCQKRLAAYLMLRLGIRGGKELWLLKQQDIQVLTDARGEEYVLFQERTSKTQEYTIDRNQEHQFHKAYHSYEPDLVFTVKQYYRHLAPLTECGVVDDLFTTPNQGPVGIVWYNMKSKVSKERSGQWLAGMLKLVGLLEKLFSNKSGRVSLITRMAAQGVPDEVGMILSGHQTVSGYSRYDRTIDLKAEAATLCASRRDLDYNTALKEVTERHRREQVESSVALKPLVAPAQLKEWEEKQKGKGKVDEGSTSTSDMQVLQQSTKREGNELVQISDCPLKMARWHRDYDGIDWELAAQKDPVLARALGGRSVSVNTVAGNSFSNMQNCTIQIICQPPRKEENKENVSPLDTPMCVEVTENLLSKDTPKQMICSNR